MSQGELYHWLNYMRQCFRHLKFWQATVIGLYSYGIVQARHCAPSRVAEKLGLVGKADSLQRRLERYLANDRICWQSCSRAWARWVLIRYHGERLILLVDETKLGGLLSVMVVGLAYRGSCLPLAFWAYRPHAWPMSQVALITTLLGWIAPAIPPGVIPLVQADRGLGTSPDLIREIADHFHWHYLFRVQKQTRFRFSPNTLPCALSDLLPKHGQCWHGRGEAFKKAGWLATEVHLLWGPVHREAWCLVTNCPGIDGWEYAVRYWQEGSFRDLKSDGWQWQTSRITTPSHANRLLLVMVLAYAWVLSLGSLAFDDPDLRGQVVSADVTRYSLFRLGFRLLERFAGGVQALILTRFRDLLVFFDGPTPSSVKCVGA
jgi:hypothetical protein